MDRLPTPAERARAVRVRALAKHPAPLPAAPALSPTGARRRARRRARRPPTTPPPPPLILDEDRTPTWPELFAWGLRIRLARRAKQSVEAVQREHNKRVKAAARLVRRLPQDGRHERRKAGELVAHAWDTLPTVNATREAVVTAGRAFLAAVDNYVGHAVYMQDQAHVNLLAALAPHIAPALTGLHRPGRRSGHIDAGLHTFRSDTVGRPGGFRTDADAETVAAACGVLRVGPRP